MLHRLISKLSYANVMSTLAVFGVLAGGTAIAATAAKNSVGSSALKRNAVKNSDIARNAVTSAKVKNGTLIPADFKAGTLTSGPTGPAGPAGTPGAAGAKGDKGDKGDTGAAGATNVVVRTNQLENFGTNGYADTEAQCNAGERAVSGGAGFVNNDSDVFQPNHTESDLLLSIPVDSTGGALTAGETPAGWRAAAQHLGGGTRDFRVYVVCAAP